MKQIVGLMMLALVSHGCRLGDRFHGHDMSVVVASDMTIALDMAAPIAVADLSVDDMAALPPDLYNADLAGADLAPRCGGPYEPCCAGSTCSGAACCAAGACVPSGENCTVANSGYGGTVCSNGACAACGTSGAPCCQGNTCGGGCCDPNGTCVNDGDTCPSFGASCASHECGGCGGGLTNCCSVGTAGLEQIYCTDNHTVCAGSGGNVGECVACGSAGGECCNLNTCLNGGCCVGSTFQCVANGAPCGAGLGACNNGSCGACGGIGQPCCAGNKCTSGSTVCLGGECAPCGGKGQNCCVDQYQARVVGCGRPFKPALDGGGVCKCG